MALYIKGSDNDTIKGEPRSYSCGICGAGDLIKIFEMESGRVLVSVLGGMNQIFPTMADALACYDRLINKHQANYSIGLRFHVQTGDATRIYDDIAQTHPHDDEELMTWIRINRGECPERMTSEQYAYMQRGE